jgi:hypothetical protein
MADETKATSPLASGLATTEGQYTLIGLVVGLLMMVLGALLPVLSKAQALNPNNVWLSVAAMVCGAVVSGAGLLGYNRGRALVKSTQVQALLAMGVPLVTTAIANALLKGHGVALPADGSGAVPNALVASTQGGLSAETVTPLLAGPGGNPPVPR